MAATVRSPEEMARAEIEGRRLAAELIDEIEADGTITREQANMFRDQYRVR